MNSVTASFRAFLLAVLLLLNGVGCATRTIIVPYGEPVRVARPVRAQVWVADKNGTEVLQTITIPAGWYALPDTVNRKPAK